MKIICTPTEDSFCKHYQQQHGNGGITVYRGHQRGDGLFGSIMRGLIKTALPVVKNIGKSVGKSVLNAGVGVAADVLEGHNIKDSVRQRAAQQLRSAVQRKRTTELKKKKSTPKRKQNRKPRTTEAY